MPRDFHDSSVCVDDRDSAAASRAMPRWRVGDHRDAPRAPFPMCFTADALETLLRTVGSLPPESGAKGFGPAGGMGFDVIEFDHGGSQRAGGAVYSPDTAWGEERCAFHLAQPDDQLRLWSGDLHSHPGGYGWPSAKSGPGLGDLGYVEAYFEHNELAQWFLLPILTETATGEVVIHPWICKRGQVHTPMIADLVVCEPDRFPQREFNPAWLAATGQAASAAIERIRVYFEVTVPPSTPHGAAISVCGDIPELGNWNGGGLALQQVAPNRYVGTVEVAAGTRFEWKVTRGSWSTVETFADGADTPNRLGAEEAEQVLVAHVGGWADRRILAPCATLPPSAQRQLQREYTKRLQGLISPRFHGRRILTVGVGAGSYAVEKLARLSPAELRNVDFDTVEVSNLARTAFAFEDVGALKVDALARRIQAVNPLVDVRSYPRSFTEMTEAELDEVFDGVDFVFAGTDRLPAQARLNEQAVRRGIPAVFVGIHAGGNGGRIVWYVPGVTGCYRCVARERYEAAAAGEPADLNGMVGALVDCQFIDMIALKIALAILERGQDSHYARFYDALRGRNDVVVRAHPDYEWGRAMWDAVLADLPTAPKDFASELKQQVLLAMDTLWLQVPRDPSCSVCGDGTRS